MNGMFLSELVQKTSDILSVGLTSKEPREQERPCDPSLGASLVLPQFQHTSLVIRQSHGRDMLCNPRCIKMLISHGFVVWSRSPIF